VAWRAPRAGSVNSKHARRGRWLKAG
jgi:hypothetical protein